MSVGDAEGARGRRFMTNDDVATVPVARVAAVCLSVGLSVTCARSPEFAASGR